MRYGYIWSLLQKNKKSYRKIFLKFCHNSHVSLRKSHIMSFPLTPPSYQIVICKSQIRLYTVNWKISATFWPFISLHYQAKISVYTLIMVWLKICHNVIGRLTVDILSTIMLLMGYKHMIAETVMTCTLVLASGQTFCIVTFFALFKINNMLSNIFQTIILWGWIKFLSPVQTKESEHTGMNWPLSARLKPASQIIVTSTGYVQLAPIRTLTTSLIWHPAVMAKWRRSVIWSHFTVIHFPSFERWCVYKTGH